MSRRFGNVSLFWLATSGLGGKLGFYSGLVTYGCKVYDEEKYLKIPKSTATQLLTECVWHTAKCTGMGVLYPISIPYLGIKYGIIQPNMVFFRENMPRIHNLLAFVCNLK